MFYKRLLIPISSIAIALGFLGFIFTGEPSLKIAGLAYIVLSPFFHYFIYEGFNPNEYYFFYNLGLSKLSLWVGTLMLSSVIGVILILL